MTDPESAPIVTYRDHRGDERRLIIRLETGTNIPAFEQLRAQLSVMAAVGRLEPQSKLPTVRELAAALDLAPGTVARAYRELENDGIVEGRGRRGTFVVDEPPHSEPLQERRERVAAAAGRFIFELRMLGVGLDDALEAAKAADRRHDAKTHDPKTKAAPAQ
ncbi:MAG: GntR family transcriptional regulator [Acidimicrobiaceae bacterium]|nr:GntR family transcriptional regulator [Acidimicrobiaceae bacterium]